MKKIIALSMALILALAFALAVFAVNFGDVNDGDYYASAAEAMAQRGILSGYGDGDYHGGEPVTRAHIAALVCKMLGKADEAAALAGKTVFKDVNEGAWYTGYINYAVANKIIDGDGDSNFRPDDFVKYEEVVKVIVCVLGLDKDVKVDKADWSKGYIEVADKAKLTEKLIGEKGTPMLRSDIAVITAAAVYSLDNADEEATTTTKRRVSGGSSGGSASTTAATTKVPEPENTTAAQTTAASYEQTTRENQLPTLWFD